MNIVRRDFLSLATKGAAALMAVAAFPSLVFARNDKAFGAHNLADAVANRYPGMTAADSDKITLKAPAIAENGAVVPLTVKSSLDNVKSISIFVENNPAPLATSFNLGPQNIAEVSVRIRMGKTSNVIAMVETDAGLFQTKQEVKVTIGGCGG